MLSGCNNLVKNISGNLVSLPVRDAVLPSQSPVNSGEASLGSEMIEMCHAKKHGH